MSKISPVIFPNRAGLRLFGVMHEPAHKDRKDIAILLLSPGIKMRVGPNLLYKTMADAFVHMGYMVFRYDFYGLGDSEGELTEEILPDVYNHIEVGRYIDDTIDAMNWVEKTHGITKFILSGLCGGAITGLLAASNDARAIGLLGLGITPVLASSAANPGRYMTVGQLEDMGRTYIKKLLDLKSWFRLLTFQSDYSVIWKTLVVRFRKKQQGPDKPVHDTNKDDVKADNSNPLFPSAFMRILESKRKILLIFGGGDRLLWEFEEKFESRYQEKLRKYKDIYKVCVVEHANHVLSYRKWQQQMVEYSRDWLMENYS